MAYGLWQPGCSGSAGEARENLDSTNQWIMDLCPTHSTLSWGDPEVVLFTANFSKPANLRGKVSVIGLKDSENCQFL